MSQDKNTRNILLLIVIIGLIVRFWSIHYGLPEIKYIDAGKTVSLAKRISFNILNGKFDIDPQKYQYPTFYINILALEFAVYGVGYGLIHTLSGKYGTFKEAIRALYKPAGLEYPYKATPPVFYLIARVTSALAGALSILFVFLLGAIAFKDRRIGLVAAFFLALMFGHVKDAHYPMTDATMCLLGIISAYYIAKINKESNVKNYILAGAFMGLGISTKYFPLFYSIPFGLVIIKDWLDTKKIERKNLYKKIVCGALMILIFFILGTPIFLVSYKKYLKSSTYQVNTQKQHRIAYTQNGYFDYLFNPFPINNEPFAANGLWSVMGMPMLIVLLLGIFYSLYMIYSNKSRNKWIDFGLTLMVITFYIFMAGEGKKRIVRYFYFCFPIYALIAARFLTEAIDFLLRKKEKGKGIILLLVSVLVVLPTGIRTIKFNYLRSHTDTRLIAGKWFEQNIASGSKIFMPILYHPIISTKKYPGSYYRGDAMGEFNPTVEMLQKEGFEYIITSSYDSMVFYSPDAMRWNSELSLKWRKFFNSLDKQAKLIKRFENNTKNKPGPEIKIYKL